MNFADMIFIIALIGNSVSIYFGGYFKLVSFEGDIQLLQKFIVQNEDKQDGSDNADYTE